MGLSGKNHVLKLALGEELETVCGGNCSGGCLINGGVKQVHMGCTLHGHCVSGGQLSVLFYSKNEHFVIIMNTIIYQ
jgi:hypothetical protein